MEKYTVSLDEFVKYIICKWKVTVVYVVLFVVCFLTSAFFLGEKIEISPSEDYIVLKEEEAVFEKYIEEAPIMKVDPNNIHQRIVYLSNITKRDSLKNYVDAGTVWENLEDEIFKTYSWDHVTWSDSGEQTAEIKIQYYDAQKCENLANYLAEQIQVYDSEVEVLVGDAHTTTDGFILDVQSYYTDHLRATRGELEYVGAGYTIETSLPISVMVGVLAGICVSIVHLFVSFYHNKK